MDMHELLRTQSLLIETVDMQKKLLAQAARLSEIQQDENARLQQQLIHTAAALQQATQRLESGGHAFGQEALAVIRAQGGQTLAQGAEQKLQQFREGIDSATGRLEWAGKVAGNQAMTLTRAQTTMVWKSLGTLAVGAVLALGGASAWAWTKKQEADRYQVEVELTRAINQADVIKCGDNLCANVETKGKPFGDKGQHRLVKPRP